MKKLAEKRWVRAIAAVLFFLCLAGSAATAVIIQYARGAGWYSMPASGNFAGTTSCQNYVLGGLSYVTSNMRWKKDVTAGYLGSYAGEAFSYVIKDSNGRVTVDTRPENAVYVTEMQFSLEYNYYNYYTEPEAAPLCPVWPRRAAAPRGTADPQAKAAPSPLS